MYYLIIGVMGYMLGLYVSYTDVSVNKDFYKENCVASPGQISIMKYAEDGKAQCTITQEIKPKGSSNLKDWR
jgi:hypothetical protein